MADGYGSRGELIDKTTNGLRQRLNTRHNSLKSERSSWYSHWQEMSRFLSPRTGRFLVTDRNRGQKKHNDILDATGLRAVRILGAGMMTGMNSPSKPWVRMETYNPDLMKRESIKVWCNMVTERMRDIFARSNTYRVLHSMYEELGVYGTACALVRPDPLDIIRLYPLTIGEYSLATDQRGEVDTLYREYQMTVAQMVKDFGKENLSDAVVQLYNRGNDLDAWFDVVQAIEPRADRQYGRMDSRNMPWRSTYFEPNQSNPDKLLRDSGFNRFPAICPRWVTSGQDIYGSSPGMEALGDVKELQFLGKRKQAAIDYQVKPPLQVPVHFKNNPTDIMPGGITYFDQATPHGGIRSAFDVNLRLDFLLEHIRDKRTMVDASFYVDLFLMLQGENQPMTAREVVERHEEKLLMLGPVLERLQNEMLKPLIDITFDAMLERGVIPAESIPEEIRGQDLKVVFVGLLAQAQRMAGIANIERGLQSVGALIAPFKPEVFDKIDSDTVVDTLADMLGWDPDMVHSEDEVGATRDARAQAQAVMAQVQAAPQLATAGKDVAQAESLAAKGA